MVNMRLDTSLVLAKQEEIANFGKWILSIGDGNDALDEKQITIGVFVAQTIFIHTRKKFNVCIHKLGVYI